MLETTILMAAAAIVTAAYLLISRKRRIPEPRFAIDGLPDIRAALPQIAGLAGGSVSDGNSVAIYQNGALLNGLCEAIGNARHSVHLATFVWRPGALEEKVIALLTQKALEGLRVRVLIDSVGGKTASRDLLDSLVQAGGEVAFYHPIHKFSLRRFNNRLHRKMLVVDSDAVFIFGHGIADAWCGDAEDAHHWRDTGICIHGPVVCSLQVIFMQDWMETHPPLPVDENLFVQAPVVGTVTTHVASSATRGRLSSVAMLYMLAIASAREEIVIQNPYFAPGKQILELLEEKVRWGVTVHLMLPGNHNDSWALRRAGRRLYKRLLEAGIELYEFRPTLLHQKILIIDKVWSHVGSTNFDARSMQLNAEIGVGLLAPDIARDLRAAFERDRLRSQHLTRADWKAPPWHQQAVDWCVYQLHEQL